MSTADSISSYPTERTSTGKLGSDEPPVIIVGGGLAGLATAAVLSQHHLPVLLLESRPRLGGRASSVVDATSGMLIDTCQHVAMGCCTNFLHFCDMLGVSSAFRTAERLHFIAPDGTIVPFTASSLPAPFHLTRALAKLPYLNWREKWILASGIRRLIRLSDDEADRLPFADWLIAAAQPERVIERFWNVVLVSALSESADRISTRYARQVIVEAFLRHRRGWEVHLPIKPLTEIYAAMVRELESRGVIVRVQAGVRDLEATSDRVTAVVLRDESRLSCSDCVLAVSFDRVMSLLPEALRSDPALAGIAQLQAAPISSVHLWFDREVCPLPHAVFVDRFSQWIFQRSSIADENNSVRANPELSQSFYYQVVISASRNVVELDSEKVVEQVLDDLRRVWPEVSSARLLQSRVLTDHRAVFSPLAGVDRLRPEQQSPIQNLQLAGDWTKTGWPATMESAVRSGFLAAENILRQRGIAANVVQETLPGTRLGKWLLGL
ncbi:MAG: hydroxysqualene dehydroxylase HpnE [Planctomycetaceae bacterium]